MKQVEKDGLLLWEVSHCGMVRYFKHDWQAKWHFESCVRLYRSRITGKAGLIPAGQLGVQFPDSANCLAQEA